ncbi:hypothetical protein RAS1_28930 [Phycisphaerae bacterium RAS1]|nr:hypothetical protein RAS1_28930 [Phycisphaerae bacterium RAS1]
MGGWAYSTELQKALLWVRDNFAAGDMNCDGAVNILDINPFVLALQARTLYEAQYPDCDYSNADMNGDGDADILDINPFVVRLSAE